MEAQSATGRILIVDDEHMVRDLFLLILEPRGYKIGLAGSGRAALDMLAKQPYDVIATDLHMPGMDGESMLRDVWQKYPETRTFVVSGFALPESLMQAVEDGVTELLSKPVREKDLVDTIERLMVTKQYRGAPYGPEPGELEPEPEPADQAVESDAAADSTGIYPCVVGGLVHNALNTMGASVARMEMFRRQENRDAAAADEMLDQLELDAQHLQTVLQLIQSISREYYSPREGHLVRHTARFERILKRYRDTWQNITYESEFDPELDETEIPAGVMVFLVDELLKNASRACTGKSDAKICVVIRLLEPERLLSVECTDTGAGFPQEILAQVASGKMGPPETTGTGGYGLYLMKELALRLKGGRVIAENRNPSGARIQVLLPIRARPE